MLFQKIEYFAYMVQMSLISNKMYVVCHTIKKNPLEFSVLNTVLQEYINESLAYDISRFRFGDQ